MQIQFLNLMPNFSVNNHSKSNVQQKNNFILSTPLKNDTFVKINNISFKAKETNNDENNLLSNLAAIGVVAAPLLLSIAAATKLAKHQSTEDIFLPDGTYFMNTNEFKLDSKSIIADGDDGIFKVKGTGIDIDPKKYDYDVVDVENGIYRNNDGSVDIDLFNNKYIDKENGIFIDPDNKISAIEVNGHLETISIPTFGSGAPIWNPGGGIGGSGYPPHREYPWYAQNRSEFIKTHDGKTPEEFFGDNAEQSDIASSLGYGKIKPDDYRSTFQKLKDFFTNNSQDSGYDKTKIYDIFGNQIVKVEDNAGNIHTLSLNDEMTKLFHDKHIDEDTIVKITKFMNDNKLENYITHNFSDYQNLIKPEYTNMEDFLHSISYSADVSDLNDAIIDDINMDPDTISDIPEAHSFLKDLIAALKEELGE